MNDVQGPKKESVWDHPRPPRIEKTPKLLKVVFDGLTLAETKQAFRVLETSHPPVYYFPPQDVQQSYLVRSSHQSNCEFKGSATYYNVTIGGRVATNACWSYHDPLSGYSPIKDHIAFYPGSFDACYADGEIVQAQPGDYYGGWITSEIEGPFKGGRGTRGW